jgi:hypothetical protein
MKPAHRYCGYVQGAWWPRSTRLTTELPSLLAALALRYGPIDRVRFHESDWSRTPQRIRVLNTNVVLDPHEESPHLVTVFGPEFGRVTLLVVPPYTDPHDAYTAVTTAASADNASTPDQLLGISPHRTSDRRLARLALHRWETDGGALDEFGV